MRKHATRTHVANTPDVPEGDANDYRIQQEFNQLAIEQDTRARESAKTWRDVITGTVGIATAVLVVKGRDSAGELTTVWRALAMVVFVVAIAAGVAASWWSGRAIAGRGHRLTLDEFRAYGSRTVLEFSSTGSSVADVRRAQQAAIVGLGLFLSAVFITWWAPADQSTPKRFVQVVYNNTSACGVLGGVNQGMLVVYGGKTAVKIPLADVTGLLVVDDCA